MTLLADAEWFQWSDSEISRRCGVSRDLATTVRSSLAESASEKPQARTYVTKHGTEATMKVGKIGKVRDRIVGGMTRTGVADRREQMREMAAHPRERVVDVSSCAHRVGFQGGPILGARGIGVNVQVERHRVSVGQP